MNTPGREAAEWERFRQNAEPSELARFIDERRPRWRRLLARVWAWLMAEIRL
jgi:hypothetical protein